MDIYLANPRGFCAGVDRAIDIVERALQIFGAPVYVRHEVVHNRFVVDDLAGKGAVFVEELDQIPDGAARHARAAEEVILIGHAGHPEVEGTLGQYDAAAGGHIYLVETTADIDQLQVKNPDSLAYVTQTTLSVDDTQLIIGKLRERFPQITGPRKDDICYATQNRQDAVRELAQQVDIFLVLGSTNSSNSNRLRELAEKQGVAAYLIDGAGDIDSGWLKSAKAVGVTAGASAPEILVQEVIDHLRNTYHARVIQNGGQSENVSFQLPRELRS